MGTFLKLAGLQFPSQVFLGRIGVGWGGSGAELVLFTDHHPSPHSSSPDTVTQAHTILVQQSTPLHGTF